MTFLPDFLFDYYSYSVNGNFHRSKIFSSQSNSWDHIGFNNFNRYSRNESAIATNQLFNCFGCLFMGVFFLCLYHSGPIHLLELSYNCFTDLFHRCTRSTKRKKEPFKFFSKFFYQIVIIFKFSSEKFKNQ